MELIEMKTAKITEKGQIAIPKDIRKLGGFRQEDKVAILVFKGKIELMPLKDLTEDMFILSIAEKTFAKNWLSKEEDELWKNL